MKHNTRKIGLALYPTASVEQIEAGVTPDSFPSLTREQLRVLVPELTEAGFNSLLFLLSKRQFLIRNKVNQHFIYSLSTTGLKQLESQFPALLVAKQAWQGQWQLIVFLQAPNHDQHFRYLRHFLLNHACISLQRAVFIYPGQLPDTIWAELRASYQQAVLVLNSTQWLLGDPRIVIGQKINLQDDLTAYSGISKELQGLTDLSTHKKAFSRQSKVLFSSIFDRFMVILEQSSGLIRHYYPQVEGPIELLEQLQKLAQL